MLRDGLPVSLTARAIVVGAVAAAVLTAGGAMAGPAVVPGRAVTPPYVTLTAATVSTTGFVYTGTSAVTTPSGDLTVLDFTLASADFVGLAIVQRCDGGLSALSMASTASATGMTLNAVSLTATVAGTTTTYDAANPPSTTTPFPFPSPLTMTDVTVSATVIAASRLTLPDLSVESATCTP